MSWGKVDYKELENFHKKVQRFSDIEKDKFFRDCCHELAGRFLNFVVPRTPVGQYPPEDGRVGGTLRRGWTGGKDINPSTYAKSMSVRKMGADYTTEIINPTEYGSYVEYGHRQHPGQYVSAIGKRLVRSWVPGKKFQAKSEEDLRSIAPALLNKLVDERMRKLFK